MTVHQEERNGPNNHRPIVSSVIIPYSKTAGDVPQRDGNLWTTRDDDSWSWDCRSSGTSISWPEEMEEVATKKVIGQWEAVQRTLYDEDDQVTSESLRAECLQWRTQRPHLRILGKGLQARQTVNKTIEDHGSVNIKENGGSSMVEEVIEEHNVVVTNVAAVDLTKEQLKKQKRKEILDIILEFVFVELLASNKNNDSLSQNLDTVLRITPAPTYSGRNPLRDHKTANELVIPLHQKTKLHKTEISGCRDVNKFPRRLPDIYKNDIHADKSGKTFVGRESVMPISARGQTDVRDTTADGVLLNRDRLYTPQLPRNSLGTVFTEKIIVSPVPFATSTKESFSTLKSTPIRSMRLSLESPPVQRSARSMNSGFKATSARRAGLLHIPQVHSAWQAPVCPTIWPKNIKLAPIDISRLPSSQRRSLPTSFAQPRKSRNSLSPIPREIMPVSPLAIQESEKTCLEIHGKQIVKQKSRINSTSAGWESSPQNLKRIRKKMQSNNER